jgi:hypothetical protein
MIERKKEKIGRKEKGNIQQYWPLLILLYS